MVHKVFSSGTDLVRVQNLDKVIPVSRSRELIDAFLELIKIRITFFVGMSSIFGGVLAASVISPKILEACTGIFLLSCASAAMNHYQERNTDGLMRRTMNRPLPSGILQPHSVLVIIGFLSLAGSVLILLFGNIMALFLSWLAFFSYNLIYTPLKKITPFAVIPGSFVGAFPVMAGWSAALEPAARITGLINPAILVIASFFFIWQMPHFWLLMDIYNADYKRGGFPTLRSYFTGKATDIFTFSWIVLLVVTSLFFQAAGVVNSIMVQLIIVAFGIWLISGSYSIIMKSGDNRTEKSAFMKINVYVLAVTLVIMVDKLINII